MNNVAYGLVMQELERGDSGLRSFASVQGSLVMYPIYAFGSEAQKEHWLPELAEGERDRLLRPHRARLRQPPGGMLTRAERHGGGWVLNGTKRWITNGTLADVARRVGADEDGIRGFLVEKGRRGFEARDIQGKFCCAARSPPSCSSHDVRCPTRTACRGGGPERAALVSDAGALRHRLGRDRRGDGLLRGGAPLRRERKVQGGPLAG